METITNAAMVDLPKSAIGKEILAYRCLVELAKQRGENGVYEVLRQYFYNKYSCIPKGFIDYCEGKTPEDICSEQERKAEEWLESGLRLTKEDMYPESNY